MLSILAQAPAADGRGGPARSRASGGAARSRSGHRHPLCLDLAFNPSSMSRVLVRATNWLGDAVMSLPAIRAIRGVFPHAHIAVVARPWVADLYARETSIDR